MPVMESVLRDNAVEIGKARHRLAEIGLGAVAPGLDPWRRDRRSTSAACAFSQSTDDGIIGPRKATESRDAMLPKFDACVGREFPAIREEYRE
jgi:hypothetical protein